MTWTRTAAWRLRVSLFTILVDTNPGLPRPGSSLDAKLLRVPGDMPLVVLAATYHQVAYYAICDLQEQAAPSSLRSACEVGRLQIGFIADAGPVLWFAMHFEQALQRRVQELLAAHAERSGPRDEEWRDRLGLLLLCLPALLAEADPELTQCTHHYAMLVSANRSAHEGRLLWPVPAKRAAQ